MRNNLLRQSNLSEMSKSGNNWKTGEHVASARITDLGAPERQLN